MGYVNVVWCPTGGSGVRSLTLWNTCPGTLSLRQYPAYDTFLVTHPTQRPGQSVAQAKIDTLVFVRNTPVLDVCVADSIWVGREPYFIESKSGIVGGLVSGINAPGRYTTEHASLSCVPSVATTSARIIWSAPRTGTQGSVVVLDIAGREIQRMPLTLRGAAASGVWKWDIRDTFGRRVPAGIYFVHLDLGTHMTATQKMVVLK